jgi:ribokinase
MQQIRAVVQGSLIFDFLTKAKVLPKPGQTVSGTNFGMFSGGKGANQAVQLARMGARVHMIGRVGCDFMGDFLLEKIRAEGIDASFILKDEKINTSLCAIHIDEEGRNDIIIVPLANARCGAGDVDAAEEQIAAADIVLTQMETTAEAMERTVKLAAKYGKKAVLNTAPAGAVSPEILEKVFAVTPNESEAEQITGIIQDDFEAAEWRKRAAARFHEMGAERVVITLGAAGCYYSGPGEQWHIPAYSIKAEDSTAAGDAFNGALCYALALGKSMKEAVWYGNAAGAIATSRFGSQASLCSYDELTKFMNRKTIPAEGENNG